MAVPSWRALFCVFAFASAECEEGGHCSVAEETPLEIYREDSDSGLEENALRVSLLQRTPKAEVLAQEEKEGWGWSCHDYKCGGYTQWHKCHCNSECKQHNNCCADYEAVCAPAAPATPAAPAKPKTPKFVMKGLAWGPAPETKRGSKFERDDFLSEAGAPLYMPWGRGDFQTMRALGANTVRLYGMDPTQNHTMGLDEAHRNGLSIVAGVSDWPYLQMPGSCQETGGNCYQQIYDWYMMVLDTGLTVGSGEDKSYHPALKSLIVINEPEIGKFDQSRRMQCEVVVSALDAIISAEKEKDITGNLISFTVAYSMAGFYGGPALGQMEMLFDCMQHIEARAGGYKPVNDVKQVYLNRFVNSFNTHNNAGTIKALMLNKYAKTFWSHGVEIPLMIGEYHASTEGQKSDLKHMLDSATDGQYPFFLGYNFFEFQTRYDKAQNWQHEMTFGMFGFDFDCNMGNLTWWGGGANFGEGFFGGKAYPIHNLVPRKDPRGYLKAKALAEAYGGDEGEVDYSCKQIEVPADFVCRGCWSAPAAAAEDESA